MQKAFKKHILILLLLLTGAGVLCAQKNVLNQKISLYVEDKSLNFILNAISTQYQLQFSFNPDEMDAGELFSISKVNTPLHEVLTELFQNKPYNFKLHGRQIVFYRDANKKIESPIAVKPTTKEKEAQPQAKPPPIKTTVPKVDTLYIKQIDTLILYKTKIQHDTVRRVDTVYKEKPTARSPLFKRNTFKNSLLSEQRANKNNGFLLGGYYEYIWANPNYKSENSEMLSLTENAEKRTIKNFSAGLLVDYNFKKFSARTGLTYTRLGESFEYSIIEQVGSYRLDTVDIVYTLETPLDTTWFYITDSSWVNTNVNRSYYNPNSYRYFEVPVHFKYSILVQGNMNLYALAGMNLEFLLNTDALRFNEKNEIVKTTRKAYSGFNMSYQLGLGTSIFVADRISIFAEAAYKQQLINMNTENYPIDKRFRLFRAKFGVQFKL